MSSRGGSTKAKAEANGKKVGRPAKTKVVTPVLTKQLAIDLYQDESTKRRWQELRDAKLANDKPDMVLRFRVETEIQDQAIGNPMDTVNHLHDKPLDVNMTLSLGEGMRIAMQKAEERVRARK